MNFEVNGKSYFLTVLEESGDLALFEPVRGGVERVRIANDTGPMVVVPAHLGEELTSLN